MRTITDLTAFLLAALLAESAAAQRTWIVDDRGGPGVDFTDVPPAVQTADPGDTILVRPGTAQPYTTPTITKGVRVVGDGSVPIQLQGIGIIENVPPGQTCVLSNFSIPTAIRVTRISCRNSSGTVILDRVDDPLDGSGQLFVTDCDRLIANRCRFWNSGGSIVFRRSRVLLLNSQFRGIQGTDPDQAAVEIAGGHLTIVDCFIRGADGWEAWCGGPFRSGTPAVFANLSTVLVQGRSHLEGGLKPGCSPLRAEAVRHNGPNNSVTIVDPLVTNVGPFDSRGTFFREMAAVSPSPLDATGSQQTIISYGPTGSTAALFASVVTGHPPVQLGIGDFWLHPNLSVHVATGSLTRLASRAIDVTVTLPPSLLPGFPLLWQAGMLTPAGDVELSSPAVTIVP